ncbi:DNA polymerase I A, chloroplastic/mitochondrial [Trifolium repens]|nr:DNA polymerase I A, chloroplastic/mitochondrial [Trifolium repens]
MYHLNSLQLFELTNKTALEKDRYKIREALIAAPGNSLIVADYGQLELRILAHLTNYKNMLEAFEAGGDFHSRTAMNMYPYILQAVDNKEVLLEWHPQLVGWFFPQVPRKELQLVGLSSMLIASRYEELLAPEKLLDQGVI